MKWEEFEEAQRLLEDFPVEARLAAPNDIRSTNHLGLNYEEA